MASASVIEQGRDKVLVAGASVFGERGYHAASISEIAQRAGIAKSVIYHHFRSKGALYCAILEAHIHELVDRVASALAEAEDLESPRARVRVGLDAYLQFLQEHPAAWRLLLRDGPADPELVDTYDRLQQERSEALSVMMASAPSANPEHRRQKKIYSDVLTTAIRAFVSWWYDHPDLPRTIVVDGVLDFASVAHNRIVTATADGGNVSGTPLPAGERTN